MKKCKKLVSLIALLLCAVMMLPLTGCEDLNVEAPDHQNVEVDTTKAQLYVANFNGGFGTEWLSNAAKRFEEKYKDVEFLPGTKGVQVLISNSKTSAEIWLSTADSSINEVFFTENFIYGDFVSRGAALDITDLVTDDLSASTVLQSITGSTIDMGDTGSVADKLTQSQKDYYEVDGKYYALPHFMGTMGIVYDIDLFNDERLYFAADKDNGNNGFIIRDTDVKSNGPDGVAGTNDDGLPATFDEFYALCEYMKEKSIVPLTWAVPAYMPKLLDAVYAQNAGFDEYMLNYTFSGTANTLLDDNLEPMGPVEITAENGYMLARQEGLYASLDFMYNIITKELYGAQYCFSTALTHLEMQEEFLKSRFNAKPDIAMVVEGNWWENEANAVWTEMENTPGASKSERNIGFMPLPFLNESLVGTKRTLVDANYSAAFIKAGIAEEKIPLAKLFLQFTSTEAELQHFTTTVGQPRNFEYDLTDEQYNSLSTFQKTVWDLKSEADVVYPYSDSPLYAAYPSAFRYEYYYKSSYLGISYAQPYQDFYKAASAGLDAKQYWLGHISLNSKSVWENAYGPNYGE